MTPGALPKLSEKSPLDLNALDEPSPDIFRLGSADDAVIDVINRNAAFDNWFGLYRLGPRGEILEPQLFDPRALEAPIRLSDIYDQTTLAETDKFGVFLVADGGERNARALLHDDLRFVSPNSADRVANFDEATEPLLLEATNGQATSPVRGNIFHALAPEIDGTRPLNIGGAQQAVAGILKTDSRTGVIETDGETDLFRLKTKIGAEYLITLRGEGGRALHDPSLALLDSSGTYFADGGDGRVAEVAFGGPAEIIFIEAAANAFDETGSYELSVTLVDDLPEGPGATASLHLGDGGILGVVSRPHDRDWYRLKLDGAVDYRVELQGASSAGGTLEDPLLALYDAAGHVIATDDDSGVDLDSQLVFTAPESGTYFLEAGAFDQGIGSYRIVAAQAGRDVPGDISTNAELAPQAPISGTIAPGADEDWYRLQVDSDFAYEIELRSLDQGDDPLDPLLEVRDVRGGLIAENDDFGDSTLDSLIDYLPETDGEVFVVAKSFGGTTGSYSLTAFLIDAVADGPDTRRGIEPDTTITGIIDTSFDEDWYRIELDPISRYRFDLTGNPDSRTGPLSDPLLELRDIDGNLVRLDDDSGDGLAARIDFATEGLGGTYYLVARGFDGEFGGYSLSVEAIRNSAPLVASPGDKVATRDDGTPRTPFEVFSGAEPMAIGDDLGALVVAFEDVPVEKGDRDFNDLLLSIELVDRPKDRPEILRTFEGPTGSDPATPIPADPTIAVGTEHVLVGVNNRIAWYDKSGGQEGGLTLQSFFDELSPENAPFDPKVLYDPFADRYVVLAVDLRGFDEFADDPSDDGSRLLLAISDDGNPNGHWYRQAVDGLEIIDGKNHWADFPAIAVGDDAIFITANMFTFDGAGFGGSRVWIGDKEPLYEGGHSSFARFDPIDLAGNDALSVTLQPSEFLSTTPSGADMYLASLSGIEDDDGNQVVQIITIDDALGATDPTFETQFVGIDEIGGSTDDAPQPEVTSRIDVGDQRALEAVWDDGQLYVTGTAQPTSGEDAFQSTAFWFQVDTSDPSRFHLVDQGGVGGNEIGFAVRTSYPSIAVNEAGALAIGFAASGPELFPGAYATMRNSDDPPGTVRDSTTIREGEAGIDFDAFALTNRWGDYSGTATDPVDGSFWSFNLFAPEGDDPFDQWATAIGQYRLPDDDMLV
ncbi:MAG: PPC domain-containing protein [Pseudomonadota bacterium]